MHAPPESDYAIVVNYYAPYVSGMTVTAQLVAEGLAARGERVVVVTARHDRALPARETLNGVDVMRCRVLAQVSKATVSPTFPFVAAAAAKRARLVNLHLPMPEAGPIAVASGATPVVTAYQCDVALPPGLFNRLAVAAVDRSSRLAIRGSARVVVSSHDYAASSRLAHVLRGRAAAIPPPCRVRPPGQPLFRETAGLHIGFLGRIVAEKGLEYLIEAFLELDDPHARLLLGGDYESVAGGSVVESVRAVSGGDPRIRLLGFLPDERVSDFYASLDAFVLPSVNPLEAFGIAQVEAMLLGVPVVTTDMPGVRIPVNRTGMGIVVPPRHSHALATALRSIGDGSVDREAGRRRARQRYGTTQTVDAYQQLFEDLRR